MFNVWEIRSRFSYCDVTRYFKITVPLFFFFFFGFQIVRFQDKESHQIFLEPEGRTVPELYVQVCFNVIFSLLCHLFADERK